MKRACEECGGALPATSAPQRRFCSDTCRYRNRDQRPETRAADNDRHRRRYHSYAAFRARHNAACERRRLARLGREPES